MLALSVMSTFDLYCVRELVQPFSKQHDNDTCILLVHIRLLSPTAHGLRTQYRNSPVSQRFADFPMYKTTRRCLNFRAVTSETAWLSVLFNRILTPVGLAPPRYLNKGEAASNRSAESSGQGAAHV